MTFIHGYLLGGLVLAGVPILLHLIMRQKPKQFIFPAFRFLRQKARINRRKIRLQHWLLLALRVLLIAALCFALARPRVSASRVPFGGGQAVTAALVFDTSASMEYTVGNTTRLDEAKRRAREILAELSPDSSVAILDTGDDEAGDDWLGAGQVQARLTGLRVRPANAPVNRSIERAYRLLSEKGGDGENAPPRFLFVFSDRTRASWDSAAAKNLSPPEGVNTVYIDVGVESPKDLAIDKVEVEPPVVAPGGTVQIKVTLRATGEPGPNALNCQFDPEPDPDKPVAVAGVSEIVTFAREAPAKLDNVSEKAVHVVVKLGTTDPLPSNKVRYATFLVRERQKVLTLVNDDPNDAKTWRAAVTARGLFQCDVKPAADADKIDLQPYTAVCLFEVPQPSAALWKQLANYVARGGGLAIVPAGTDDAKAIEDFNKNGTADSVRLLPATLTKLIKVPAKERGVPWSGFSDRHLITKPFHEWVRTGQADFTGPASQPLANGYWEVRPAEKAESVVASYADRGKHPALVERQRDRGRVLLFTTPLNGREMEPNRNWNNYWTVDSLFGLVLVDKSISYLAGELSQPELNYHCGQPITLPAPPSLAPPFALEGPDLTPPERRIPSPDNSPTLAITQTLGPGNFDVTANKVKEPFAGFSVNLRAEETVLDRVPSQEIEAALGDKTVLAPDRGLNVGELLQERWSPPVELLPWLMIFLLLALTVESLLANFFYRRQAPAEPAPAPLPQGGAP
jgi:hypothetical protein